jgi:hypothetical protein
VQEETVTKSIEFRINSKYKFLLPLTFSGISIIQAAICTVCECSKRREESNMPVLIPLSIPISLHALDNKEAHHNMKKWSVTRKVTKLSHSRQARQKQSSHMQDRKHMLSGENILMYAA